MGPRASARATAATQKAHSTSPTTCANLPMLPCILRYFSESFSENLKPAGLLRKGWILGAGLILLAFSRRFGREEIRTMRIETAKRMRRVLAAVAVVPALMGCEEQAETPA